MTKKTILFAHSGVILPTLLTLFIQGKPIVERTWVDYKPFTRKDLWELVVSVVTVFSGSSYIVHGNDRGTFTPKGVFGRDFEDVDGDGIPDEPQKTEKVESIPGLAPLPSPIVTQAKVLAPTEFIPPTRLEQAPAIEDPPTKISSTSSRRIVIACDTHLKTSTADSSTLASDQKVAISGGSEIPYSGYDFAGDGLHFRVTLGKDEDGKQMTLKGRNTWHIYMPHIDQIISPEVATLLSEPSKTENDLPQCGIELIKEFEGFESSAYADPIHGWSVPTIGYGTTIYPDGNRVKKGDSIAEATATDYLIHHIRESCLPSLKKIPTWNRMNTNQKGAILSFAYNLGSGFYGTDNFTSITAVCDSPERWDEKPWVKAQFVKYRNPGTAAEEGLKRRREAEAELFCR